MKGKWKRFMRKHPLTALWMFSIVGGLLVCFVWFVSLVFVDPVSMASFKEAITEAVLFATVLGTALGIFVIPPLVLTLIQIISLWREIKGREQTIELRHIDLTTIILGIVYNILFFSMLDGVQFEANWYEVLYNAQKHTPIFTESTLTIWVIIGIAIIGYCIVNFSSVEKIPPLLLVLGLSSMYLGTGLSIIWLIHVFKGEALPEACLFLLPICCICITARTVIKKKKEWKEKQIRDHASMPQEDECFGNEKKQSAKHHILEKCNRILSDSDRWPVAAFFLMWPLLGIMIAVLVLFGQKPDAVIKAFTETSDWNLSMRTAPQNLYMDEHYLCTVAAGGHENIVKPLRLGVRHGHEVIVNRQLCVANAFEQILEEKTPRFHRVVRGFYDKYGFPIGKLIMKSRVAADVTYYVMKPLEWMFLIVLYLVDIEPENRISIQYTGKSWKDFM